MNERTWRVLSSEAAAIAASLPPAAPTPAAASDRGEAPDNGRVKVVEVFSAATGADKRAPGRLGS